MCNVTGRSYRGTGEQLVPVVMQLCGVRGQRGDPLLTVGLLQRGRDVIPERDRHVRSGGDDPAEPGHRGDHRQHLSNLVLARARCQRPARTSAREPKTAALLLVAAAVAIGSPAVCLE